MLKQPWRSLFSLPLPPIKGGKKLKKKRVKKVLPRGGRRKSTVLLSPFRSFFQAEGSRAKM